MSGTTSVRYLSPGELRDHHNITNVQTHEWRQKADGGTPLICPVSTDLSPVVRAHQQGDIRQSEDSIVTNDQSEARGLVFNIFLWQSQICSHECLHLTALRADTLTNEWGKGLSWIYLFISSDRSSRNANVWPAVYPSSIALDLNLNLAL